MLNQKFTETSLKHALSRSTTGFFVNDDVLNYVMLCSLVRSHPMLWYCYEIMTITITIAITIAISIAITITVSQNKERVAINVCYTQRNAATR